MPQFRISGYSTYGNPERRGRSGGTTTSAGTRESFVDEGIAWVPVRVRSLTRAHEPLAGRRRRRAARRLRLQRRETAIRNGPAPNQHNAFAAFLLGLPSSVGKAVAPELPLTTRAWRQGFYARDQWQATADLTLTLGVRPSITRLSPGRTAGSNSDVTTNTVRVGGVGSVPGRRRVSERVHFAPGLGAAYRIGDKWVVRGGFGSAPIRSPCGACSARTIPVSW